MMIILTGPPSAPPLLALAALAGAPGWRLGNRLVWKDSMGPVERFVHLAGALAALSGLLQAGGKQGVSLPAATNCSGLPTNEI